MLRVLHAETFTQHALLGEWDGAVPSAHAGSPPLTVERLDALAARGLGLTTAGALLARPDGYPVALWNDDGSVPVQLTAAIAAANGSAVADHAGAPDPMRTLCTGQPAS